MVGAIIGATDRFSMRWPTGAAALIGALVRVRYVERIVLECISDRAARRVLRPPGARP